MTYRGECPRLASSCVYVSALVSKTGVYYEEQNRTRVDMSNSETSLYVAPLLHKIQLKYTLNGNRAYYAQVYLNGI